MLNSIGLLNLTSREGVPEAAEDIHMLPVAWDPVSANRLWKTELYQALVMTWEIGWDAVVIVSEV